MSAGGNVPHLGIKRAIFAAAVACMAQAAQAQAAHAQAAHAPATAPPGIYDAVGPDAAGFSTLKTAEAGVMAAQQVFMAIPEAPSAALLIIGLAAVGVAARRRSR